MRSCISLAGGLLTGSITITNALQRSPLLIVERTLSIAFGDGCLEVGEGVSALDVMANEFAR